MNERIRELAEEAGIVFWEISGDVDWRQANREHLDKFVELVVKDFQKLIKDAYLNTAPEHRDCLLMLDARVEEHFGVEE